MIKMVLRKRRCDVPARACRQDRDAEVAGFFYSGHAAQIEDRLYLLPADIGLTADTDLDLAALQLEAVLRAMEASRVMRIAFLDVGRGNPWRFAARAQAQPLPGLAALPDKAGFVVGFATSPGKSFEEGDGPLSPHAAALVAAIGDPGLEVEQMLRRVRNEVVAATHGWQIPWSLSTVDGEFFLVPPL